MKKIIIILFKLIILIAIFVWIILVFTDYFRTTQNKEPMFCIKENTKEYDDGFVYICTGLGYKYIRYNRNCLTATEFGPFIIKERTCS